MSKRSIKYSYNHKGFQIFITIYLIICTLFCLFSLFLTILNACKTNANIVNNGILGLLEGNVFQIIGENFSAAWNGVNGLEGISNSFFNSIWVSALGAFLNCCLGAILAYLFTFKTFPFKRLIFTIYISVMLLPSIMGMPILVPLMEQTFHLHDSPVGYLLPMLAGGQVSAFFLFNTFFGQQPISIYEAARVEGSGDVRMFLKITIPLALPIFLYRFIGGFASLYNDYLWASLIMENETLLMPHLQNLSGIFSNDRQGAMYMLYIISSFPLIITTAISMKFFASGDFASGMKL